MSKYPSQAKHRNDEILQFWASADCVYRSMYRNGMSLFHSVKESLRNRGNSELKVSSLALFRTCQNRAYPKSALTFHLRAAAIALLPCRCRSNTRTRGWRRRRSSCSPWEQILTRTFCWCCLGWGCNKIASCLDWTLPCLDFDSFKIIVCHTTDARFWLPAVNLPLPLSTNRNHQTKCNFFLSKNTQP